MGKPEPQFGGIDLAIDPSPSIPSLPDTNPDNKRRRKVFVATEHEVTDVPLADVYHDGYLDLYPQVKGRDFFKVYSKQDRLLFQAGSYIGLIPVNDRVVLDVRSRVPVGNLERILRIAEHTPFSLSPHLREYESHEERAPSLIDLLAESFIDVIKEIEFYGLHREYIRKTEATSFPKGRILLRETMRAYEARGIRHRVEASWFTQTTDSGPNRCLKYAVWYLAMRYLEMKPRKGLRKMIFDLNRAFLLFSGVTLDRRRNFLNDPVVVDPGKLPSIRRYYKSAINLALTIIRDRGISFEGGENDFVSASLLIDFDKVFESYLRAVLQQHFRELNSDIDVLDGNAAAPHGGKKLLFDDPPSEPAKPDIVFKLRDTTATYPLLVEVKYKKVTVPERDDINQAVTYAVSYRAPVVVIVNPRIKEGSEGLKFLGKIDRTMFYQYAFDLATSTPAVNEKKFAMELFHLINGNQTPGIA